MRILSCFLLAPWALLALSLNSFGEETEPVRRAVDDFLRVQVRGLPGDASYTIGPISSEGKFPACLNPEVSFPKGSRPWGRTSVQVQCNGATRRSLYVSVQIRVVGEYLVAGKALASGQILAESDLARQKGDLTDLPMGILTDPAQAIGRSLSMPLGAGMPLRADFLKQAPVVQQGQMVKVQSRGQGFQVASEGQALNNAGEGQVVRVRLSSGQVVSGLAKPGGVVEVSY